MKISINGERQILARYPNFDPKANYFDGFSADASYPRWQSVGRTRQLATIMPCIHSFGATLRGASRARMPTTRQVSKEDGRTTGMPPSTSRYAS